MANKYINGETLKFKGVQLSFPQLHKPGVAKGYEDSAPKYSADVIFDPEDEQHVEFIKQCNAEIKRLIKKAWGEKPEDLKPVKCFGKGEKKKKKETREVYDGYEGKYFVSGKNKSRPLCLGKGKVELTDPSTIEEVLYGGCIVEAHFQFYADVDGEGIYCNIRGVKFMRDGDEFGSSSKSSLSDFDDDDDDLEGEIDLDADLGLGDEDEFGDDIPF